jgi:hypothetical protein
MELFVKYKSMDSMQNRIFSFQLKSNVTFQKSVEEMLGLLESSSWVGTFKYLGEEYTGK